MPTPIDGLRFVHTALWTETEDIERAARTASTPEDFDALAGRVAFLTHVQHGHTTGEEVGLFPYIAERWPHLDDTYLHDHEHERALLADLAAAIEARDAEQTARLAASVLDHTKSHITKENDLVLPLVSEHFPVPVQGEMVQKILSRFTPDDMAAIVPWIVASNPLPAAVAYVRVLASVMPPPAFAAAKGWIRGGVDAERWDALVSQVDALA